MSLTGPAKDFPDSQIIKMTMELTYSQWLSVKKLFGIIIFSIGKIKLKLFLAISQSFLSLLVSSDLLSAMHGFTFIFSQNGKLSESSPWRVGSWIKFKLLFHGPKWLSLRENNNTSKMYFLPKNPPGPSNGRVNEPVLRSGVWGSSK